MTEQELIDSYKMKMPEPRASRFRGWLGWIVLYLPFAAALGGVTLYLCKLALMPWWLPVFGVVLGIILGLWVIYSRWGLPIRRPLLLFPVYLFFSFYANYLDWLIVPAGSDHGHLLFKLGFYYSIVLGGMLVAPFWATDILKPSSGTTDNS
jgi:hypothetical protein